MSETGPDKELNHGVSCCYSGGPGDVYYLPVMMCDCGFDTGRCEDWEEAGRNMDEHVAEVKQADVKPVKALREEKVSDEISSRSQIKRLAIQGAKLYTKSDRDRAVAEAVLTEAEMWSAYPLMVMDRKARLEYLQRVVENLSKPKPKREE